jgi:hypothetical protein
LQFTRGLLLRTYVVGLGEAAAAQHFGVPHPTGYPLWTLLNWLFLFLPLGNAAWEVAIFSGLCAALAVGLCAALLSSIQIWCYGVRLVGRARFLPRVVALSFSLMLAFSESMWSQAVIAEVYALHALLIAVFLVLCYSWVQRPASDRLMLGAFFALALSFSNHQLTMTLAPLPFLLILLLRRRAFIDWLFAGVLTLLLGYLAFAILSEDPAVLKTAIPFLLLCCPGFRTVRVDTKGSASLETHRVPSNCCCGRSLALCVHAARVFHKSPNELGIRAEHGGIFLLN